MEVYIPHITKNDIILIITTISWLHLVGDEKGEAPYLKNIPSALSLLLALVLLLQSLLRVGSSKKVKM